MKTKHIFGLVTAVAVTGFAASAQAGWSLNFSFGAPVIFAPPVVVAAPPCLPPIVACPPAVVYRSIPVPCQPVVYVNPGYVRGYDYRGYGPYRGQGGWGHNGHSYGGPGWRR